MKVLLIGDIVGSPGREDIKTLVVLLKQELGIDFVIANGENASGGSGITTKVAVELFASGVDVLTSGDHIWKKVEIFELINQEERILRPLNFPSGAPGRGASVFKAQNGVKVGVININGRVFMEALECPFKAALTAADELAAETKIIIVDIHAEATSEKIALGWYLDGKVSAIFGTHTHIQTADEKILPQGTAYITDVGMTGPYDSVIGMKKDLALQRFLKQTPFKYETAANDVHFSAVLVTADPETGLATEMEQIIFPKF